MFNLNVEREISCSHQLKNHNGKCRNLHGHNFKVKVQVQGECLLNEGSSKNMLVDFGDIKKVIDFYDHKHLNDVLDQEQPTAELLAQTIANTIWDFDFCIITSISVTVWETAKQSVSYSRKIHF